MKGWTIAAPSVRVARRPLGVRAHEDDLVVFRDAAGAAHVLVDRCPHRGVQLSLGSVEEGRLTCRYHGWQFEGGGRCVRIPSLRDDQRIPAGVEVPALPTAEQDGYVWAWLGRGAPRPARPLPIPAFPRRRWIQSTVPMACHWRKAIENNVDPTHAAFTHRWTHPQWFSRRFRGLRLGTAEVRTTEDGFVLFVPAARSAEDPIPARPPVSARFELPDRVTVSFHGRFEQVIVLNAISTGPHDCRLETLVTNPLPFGPKTRFTRREHVIFRQDRRVMESAERWTREIGHDFERSVEADFPMLLVRRIVELAESGRWEEKRASLPPRRVIRIRA